jgi:two-component system LytT family response regulator
MEKILIIEDEKNIRDTLEDIIELAGYKVLTACNGRIAYDIIIDNQPDLVLCDVNMPELDGFELLGVINQRLKNEIVPPFLFLTAKVEKEDMRNGMSLGADDYIFKPFDSNDILKIIRLRLDKRQQLLKLNTPSKIETLIKDFNKLALPCDDGLELISFDKIINCQAHRSYCTFYLIDNRKILVSKPMKEFEKILMSKNFLKVHKSIIINIKHVEKYVRGKAGYLLMSDGSSINISVRRKEELLQALKANNW